MAEENYPENPSTSSASTKNTFSSISNTNKASANNNANEPSAHQKSNTTTTSTLLISNSCNSIIKKKHLTKNSSSPSTKKMNSSTSSRSCNSFKTSGHSHHDASMISKNCKMFNHLFHCSSSSSSSEDSTSSSDCIILDQQKSNSNSNSNSNGISSLIKNEIKDFITISSISHATKNSSTITTTIQSSVKQQQQQQQQSFPVKHEPKDILTESVSSSSSTAPKTLLSVPLSNANHNETMKSVTDHRISHLLGPTSSNSCSSSNSTSALKSLKRSSSCCSSSNRIEKSNFPKVADKLLVTNWNSMIIKKEPQEFQHKPSDSNFRFHRSWEDTNNVLVTVKQEPHKMDIPEKKDAGTSSHHHKTVTINVKQEPVEEDSSTSSPSPDPDSEPEIKRRERGRPVNNNKMSKESKQLLLQLSESEKRKSSRLVSKTTFCNKKHDAQVMKRLKQIVKKSPDDLTSEERQIQDTFPHLVHIIKKRHETRQIASERLKEFEDSPEVLENKCTKLAQVIKNAKYLVVYTGAGISTTSGIPDYRGPNGIWTLLRNGQTLDSQSPVVLTTADPTLTHMAIKTLHSQNVIKHIVSQNCDGLHLRSGIPKTALSEVHGNMYIEVCIKCSREYVRTFDVTENTRRYEHRTGRHCYHCGSQLKDTVVHFGERGSLRWPLNWAGAEYNVARADVILCMGSSLKVLRRYPWLWGMDMPVNKRPKLFIVNLQWTPKDQFAALKIHGKCDEVMEKVMAKLNIPIPKYERESDQIFAVATPLHETEINSKSSVDIAYPPDKPYPTDPHDINNYFRFEPNFRVSLADLKLKAEECNNDDKEEEEPPIDNEDPAAFRKRTLRSQSKIKKEENKKDGKKKVVKKRDKTIIIKGNGNGWFGNAWGVKPKKRKTSIHKT